MNFVFIEFLVMSILALGITFVLFHYLKGFAEGQSKMLGGTIKYGGSLAGFVLVLFLLGQTYNSLVKTEAETEVDNHDSDFDISGEYEWWWERDGKENKGTVSIDYKKEEGDFSIKGRIRGYTYHSDVVGIDEFSRLMLIYEDNNAEMGIAYGALLKKQPDSIFLSYYDAYGFAVDADTLGNWVWVRKE